MDLSAAFRGHCLPFRAGQNGHTVVDIENNYLVVFVKAAIKIKENLMFDQTSDAFHFPRALKGAADATRKAASQTLWTPFKTWCTETPGHLAVIGRR